ncbi:unnamed protein product [Diamesa hyperborea]
MKFVFAFLLVVLAITCIAGQDDGDAVQITGNNVGDIITVGIKADAVLSSNANLNMINMILGLINKQAIKMKFAFALLLAALTITCIAGEDAVQVSGNNVGDIVTVGINANAVLSSNANVNMINAILALLNQQAIVVDADISDLPSLPLLPAPTPE